MTRETRATIPTSDGTTVHMGHFGEAKEYIIIDCKTKTTITRIHNPYHASGHEDEEQEKGKRKAILKLLQNHDVSRLAMTAMGPGGPQYFQKHGLKTVQVKPGTSIKEAVTMTCQS